MKEPKVVEYSGVTRIFQRDEQTGIQCGINDLGRLFLGDRLCWYNMEDTPENREKLLAAYEEAVAQKRQAAPEKNLFKPSEWQSAEFKFQVNAAHVAAIYDDLDSQLRRYGRRPDAAGVEVSSFLAGAKAALGIIAANTPRVWDWCHVQEVARRYFDSED